MQSDRCASTSEVLQSNYLDQSRTKTEFRPIKDWVRQSVAVSEFTSSSMPAIADLGVGGAFIGKRLRARIHN